MRQGLHGLLDLIGRPRLDGQGLANFLVDVEGRALVGRRFSNLGQSAIVGHSQLQTYLIFEQLYCNDLLIFPR